MRWHPATALHDLLPNGVSEFGRLAARGSGPTASASDPVCRPPLPDPHGPAADRPHEPRSDHRRRPRWPTSTGRRREARPQAETSGEPRSPPSACTFTTRPATARPRTPSPPRTPGSSPSPPASSQPAEQGREPPARREETAKGRPVPCCGVLSPLVSTGRSWRQAKTRRQSVVPVRRAGVIRQDGDFECRRLAEEVSRACNGREASSVRPRASGCARDRINAETVCGPGRTQPTSRRRPVPFESLPPCCSCSARAASSSSRQDVTVGRLRRRLRLSRAVIPPQMPCSISWSRA